MEMKMPEISSGILQSMYSILIGLLHHQHFLPEVFIFFFFFLYDDLFEIWDLRLENCNHCGTANTSTVTSLAATIDSFATESSIRLPVDAKGIKCCENPCTEMQINSKSVFFICFSLLSSFFR